MSYEIKLWWKDFRVAFARFFFFARFFIELYSLILEATVQWNQKLNERFTRFIKLTD